MQMQVAFWVICSKDRVHCLGWYDIMIYYESLYVSLLWWNFMKFPASQISPVEAAFSCELPGSWVYCFSKPFFMRSIFWVLSSRFQRFQHQKTISKKSKIDIPQQTMSMSKSFFRWKIPSTFVLTVQIMHLQLLLKSAKKNCYIPGNSHIPPRETGHHFANLATRGGRHGTLWVQQGIPPTAIWATKKLGCFVYVGDIKDYPLPILWNPVNSGINYRPQLVSSPDFWLPSTVCVDSELNRMIKSMSWKLLNWDIPCSMASRSWKLEFGGGCYGSLLVGGWYCWQIW